MRSKTMSTLKHPSHQKVSTKAVNRLGQLLFTVLVIFASTSAHAAGLSHLNTLLSTVAGWLEVAGIAIVTVALMWCGYKWLWDNADVRDLGKILFGSLLIGGAAEAAGILLS